MLAKVLLLLIPIAGTTIASIQQRGAPAFSALYTLTNEAASNYVASMHVGTDGTVWSGSLTATRGNGSNWLSGDMSKLTGPSSLWSASPLVVADNLLFAVNAGSNTVSLFRIDAQDFTNLTLIGEPVLTGGEFPVTLAVAPRSKLVCVGNVGFLDGIACASYSATGLGSFDAVRQFRFKQTTPPSLGLLKYVPQIFFNQDESALFALINGNATSLGSVAIYRTSSSAGAIPTVAQVPVIALPPVFTGFFAATLLPDLNQVAVVGDWGVVSVQFDVQAGQMSILNGYKSPTSFPGAYIAYAPNRQSLYYPLPSRMVLNEVDPRSGKLVRSWPSQNPQNPPAGDISYYCNIVVVGDYLCSLVASGRDDQGTQGIGSVNIRKGTAPKDVTFFRSGTITKNTVGLAAR